MSLIIVILQQDTYFFILPRSFFYGELVDSNILKKFEDLLLSGEQRRLVVAISDQSVFSFKLNLNEIVRSSYFIEGNVLIIYFVGSSKFLGQSTVTSPSLFLLKHPGAKCRFNQWSPCICLWLLSLRESGQSTDS